MGRRTTPLVALWLRGETSPAAPSVSRGLDAGADRPLPPSGIQTGDSPLGPHTGRCPGTSERLGRAFSPQFKWIISFVVRSYL
jgi:hypothetical protein